MGTKSRPQTPSESAASKPPESPFGPGKRFLVERQVTVLSLGVALLSMVAALHYSAKVAKASKENAWVVLLDDSGTYTISPASIEYGVARIFNDICVQAAELSLRRTPNGLSFPEFAERFFTGFAPKVIMMQLQSERADREQRNLFDQPEVTRVEKLTDNSRELTFRVTGKIIRSGAIEGIALREVGECTMFVKLSPQPNLNERGRYPFVCSNWGVRITWDDLSKEEWTADSQVPRVRRDDSLAR